MLYSVVFLFLLTLLIIFMQKLNIVIEYVKDRQTDKLVFVFSVLKGIFEFRYAIPKSKKKKKKQMDGFSEIYLKIRQIKAFYESNKMFKIYLGRKLVLEEFNLKIKAGINDACLSGIMTGVLWSIAGSITAYLSSNFKVMKKHIDIKPEFAENVFKLDLYCIFSIRIVNIIIVGLKMLPYFIRNRRKVKKIIGGGVSG